MDPDTVRPVGAASTTGGQTGSSTRPPGAGAATNPRFPTPPQQDESPTDSFKEAFHALGELREYVGYYVSAKIDGIKLSVRRLGVLAVLGVIGLLAGGAVIVTAGVLLCVGLAQAVAVLFRSDYGPRIWLGNLIVGLVLLLLVSGGGYFLGSRLIASGKKATVKKYELRRQRQRADYGHDVLQRASERRAGERQPR